MNMVIMTPWLVLFSVLVISPDATEGFAFVGTPVRRASVARPPGTTTRRATAGRGGAVCRTTLLSSASNNNAPNGGGDEPDSTQPTSEVRSEEESQRQLRRTAEILRLRAEKLRLEAQKAEFELATARAEDNARVIVDELGGGIGITEVMERAAQEMLKNVSQDAILRGELLREFEVAEKARRLEQKSSTKNVVKNRRSSSKKIEGETGSNKDGQEENDDVEEAVSVLEAFVKERARPQSAEEIYFQENLPFAPSNFTSDDAAAILHACFSGPHQFSKTQTEDKKPFYCTTMLTSEWGACFRGKATVDAEQLLDSCQNRLEQNATTKNKYKIFIDLENTLDYLNPIFRGGGGNDQSNNLQPDDVDVALRTAFERPEQPMVVAVRAETLPRPTIDFNDDRTEGKSWLNAQLHESLLAKMVFYVSALFVLALYGTSTLVLNDRAMDALLASRDSGLLVFSDDPNLVSAAFLPAIYVAGIHVMHQTSRQVVAFNRNVSVSWGIPLCWASVGLLGSSSVFRSFPRDRKALFDVSLAAPLTALLCSLIALFLGALLGPHLSSDGSMPAVVHAMAPGGAMLPSGGPGGGTTTTWATATAATASTTTTASLFSPRIPAAVVRGSTLSSLCLAVASPALAKVVVLDAANVAVDVHPLFAAGTASALVAALHCLPIGKSDGARLASAVLGPSRWPALTLVAVSTVVAFFYAIFQNNDLLLAHIAYSMFIWRDDDPSPRDRVSDVGVERERLYFLTLALAVLALAPCPFAGLTAGAASSDVMGLLGPGGGGGPTYDLLDFGSSAAQSGGPIASSYGALRDWISSLVDGGGGGPSSPVSSGGVPTGFDF